MTSFLALLATIIALGALWVAWMLWQRQSAVEKKLDTAFTEQHNLALKLKQLEQDHEKQETSRIAAEMYSPTAVASSSEPNPSVKKRPTIPKTKPEHDENEASSLWQDVIFLAQQGVSADKIASDLNITRGEVDLILSLKNFKPDETAD